MFGCHCSLTEQTLEDEFSYFTPAAIYRLQRRITISSRFCGLFNSNSTFHSSCRLWLSILSFFGEMYVVSVMLLGLVALAQSRYLETTAPSTTLATATSNSGPDVIPLVTDAPVDKRAESIPPNICGWYSGSAYGTTHCLQCLTAY